MRDADLLPLEQQTKVHVARADRDVRRVVEVCIDVDLQIVGIAVIDIEVCDVGWACVESLQTTYRGSDAKFNARDCDRADGRIGNG